MSYTYSNFFHTLYQSYRMNQTPPFSSVSSFLQWKSQTRRHLSSLLGIPRLESICAANDHMPSAPVLIDSVREQGFQRLKYKLETLPQVWMPYYLLIPDSADKHTPVRAMITIPAHGASKESVCGIISDEHTAKKLYDCPKESYGLEFVRRGYAVLCPDPPGYGERQEGESMEDKSFGHTSSPSPLGSSCKNLTMTADAFGLSFAGLTLWDLQRLVDAAVTLPFIDPERIGCCGFSGGGLYSLLLAGMDERIHLAAISGYLHGYCDSILETHLCCCNFVPHLWKYYDIWQIATLIAPRPLFFENGSSDPLNGPRGVEDPTEQFGRIQEIYQLFGFPHHVRHEIFQGGHMWQGLCYSFTDDML